jgi:hypothetical protein
MTRLIFAANLELVGRFRKPHAHQSQGSKCQRSHHMQVLIAALMVNTQCAGSFLSSIAAADIGVLLVLSADCRACQLTVVTNANLGECWNKKHSIQIRGFISRHTETNTPILAYRKHICPQEAYLLSQLRQSDRRYRWLREEHS